MQVMWFSRFFQVSLSIILIFLISIFWHCWSIFKKYIEYDVVLWYYMSMFIFSCLLLKFSNFELIHQYLHYQAWIFWCFNMSLIYGSLNPIWNWYFEKLCHKYLVNWMIWHDVERFDLFGRERVDLNPSEKRNPHHLIEFW